MVYGYLFSTVYMKAAAPKDLIRLYIIEGNISMYNIEYIEIDDFWKFGSQNAQNFITINGL